MLLQSHDGKIRLLPALPDVWAEGSVRGLRARGGFEVSMEWGNGRLSKVGILSNIGGKTTLVHAGKERVVELKAGETISFVW